MRITFVSACNLVEYPIFGLQMKIHLEKMEAKLWVLEEQLLSLS